MPRSLIYLVLALAWGATLLAGPIRAEGPGPRFDQQISLPGSADTKFPHIVASAGAVHIAANSGRLDASYWSRPADAPGFVTPLRLGPAIGQPDYSTASIAAGPDGTLYVAWINQPERAIYLRSRAPGADWGPTHTVMRGSPFPVAVEVAAGPDGSLFVLWRDPDRPFVFSRSRDGGRSWSLLRPLAEGAGFNAPAVAAGPGLSIAAFTMGEGDRLQIFAGEWDGVTFQMRRVSAGWADFADPSVAVAADGRAAVAWRGVADSGGAAGVFIAEREPGGAWPAYKLAGGKVIGRVTIAYDEAGGAHVLWIGEAGRGAQLWYAHRPAGGAWSGPVAAPAGWPIFNAHAAAGRGPDGQIYAQAVSERFVGDRVSALAYRFVAGGMALPAARPVLAGGAALAGGDTLGLEMHDISGAPDAMRMRWGAPPAPGDPWEPFAAAQEIAVPAGAGVERCESISLYTQVRGAGGTQEPAARASITVDRGVQAAISVPGDGAPGYVRTPLVRLHIDASADCAGLASAQVGAAAALELSTAGATLPLELPAEEGPHQIEVRLADRLGNHRSLATTVVYDATAPAFTAAGPLEIATDPRATVISTITLSGRYKDAGSALPWAVAVAASRTPASQSGEGPAWRVVPLGAGAVARAADGTIRLRLELSLAGLLPADQLSPGEYQIELRLVDRAGNISDDGLAGQVRLDRITFPRIYAPLLQR